MSRLVALETHDPAEAIAMGHCLTARTLDPKTAVTDRHPRACGWCEYPTVELQRGIEAFERWAELEDRRGALTSARHIVRSFRELPRVEQERRVAIAQSFDDEPEPKLGLGPAVEAVAPTTPPPPDVEEEPIPWMRSTAP